MAQKVQTMVLLAGWYEVRGGRSVAKGLTR